MMRDLVDVEGEFGLDVLVLPFRVTYRRAVFGAEFGELNGNGNVGGFGMPDGVADVMRERADREG